MKLRAPGLRMQSSWLLSLSTCVHAAQGVLAAYLQLYQPVLDMLAKQFKGQQQQLQPDKLSTPSMAALSVTWRQVRRIMMSLFVIVFAYWHGELLHDEASRYMAMARLLLEYPRWRWGEDINEAVQTLFDISGFANFDVRKHLQNLLPGQNELYVAMLCERTPRAEPGGFDLVANGPADDGDDDAATASGFGTDLWSTMTAFPWSNDFPVFDLSTLDDQHFLCLSGNMNYT